MSNRVAELEAAVRGVSERPGVGGLVAALGLEPRDEPFALELPGVRQASVVAVRPGARMVALELEAEVTGSRIVAAARAIRAAETVDSTLLIVVSADGRRLGVACHALGGELRHLIVECDAIRATDLETLAELVAAPGEGGVALAVRWSRALDRTRVTARFFADFRAQRRRVAEGWTGLPRRARADRERLALLFLCRLMFLYFLQRRGHLAGDMSYLPNLLRTWRGRERRRRTFYRAILLPLFFGALNRRPERRTAAARRLGDLPYLNGGLFERTPLERRHAALDLPDDVLVGVFERLLDRYRFTTRDRSDDVLENTVSAGIDPEMLGRVFEGLMTDERRGETGTFFTPAAVVDRLVVSALATHLAARLGHDAVQRLPLFPGRADSHVSDASAALVPDRGRLGEALRSIRVLDPACGSGAFLLGALSRIARLRRLAEQGDEAEIRRDIVARSLHGVDVQPDAALLCALRLWLALTFGGDDAAAGITPLPNLDRRIRQGDALLDPLDLLGGAPLGSPEWVAAADRVVRRAARSLAPLAVRYVRAEPGERERLQRALRVRETVLARAWLAAVERRLTHRLAELERRAAQRDLWGEPGEDARAAAAALPRARADRSELARLAARVEETGALPFFSFAVHFADSALAGFDLVLMNPPWVRTHRWPASLGRLVRQRFLVCRDPGWRAGTRLGHAPAAAGAQVDLALLFLERAIRVLAPGGALGMLLPAKLLRSLFGGPARRLLLTEVQPQVIEDHSLDQHAIFAADAFTVALVALRPPLDSSAPRAAVGNAVSDAGAPDSRVAHTRGRVRVVMHRRRGDPLDFELPVAELPLVPGDADSPWLLAPPEVRAVLRCMQRAGPPLGESLRVRRGVFTGANDVLLVREAEPKLGGHAWIRAEGYGVRQAAGAARASEYEALVEASALRPLLRGGDVSAWRVRPSRHIVWIHGDDGTAADPPPRLSRYLARHRARLESRSGARPGMRPGAVFRVTREALGPKVVWHDLAETLKAAAVPARCPALLGGRAPVVPLNTVYYIPTSSEADACILAAWLNSLPVRVFARAVAERAKDARFRFFAWAVGVLPLPVAWRTGPLAAPLLALSRDAHETGALSAERQSELDSWVGLLYGLGPSQLAELARFDRWLSGGAA